MCRTQGQKRGRSWSEICHCAFVVSHAYKEPTVLGQIGDRAVSEMCETLNEATDALPTLRSTLAQTQTKLATYSRGLLLITIDL